MKPLAFDVETTTTEKGNPFHPENRLVTVAVHNDEFSKFFCVYDSQAELEELRSVIKDHKTLVAFNAKFDCHWLYNVGIDISEHRIWDTQYAVYKLRHQTVPYLSLNQACEMYGLPQKLDVVKEEYWAKGIDTPNIPLAVLKEYNLWDAKITWDLYQLLQEQMPEEKKRIISLGFQDIHCLLDMERNGMKYDVEKSLSLAEKNNIQIAETKQRLDTYHSVPHFNWNSPDHISALLFGGVLTGSVMEPVGVYKTGPRKGELKLGKKEMEYHLKRRFKPIKGSELKKEGLWSTNDATLNKLKDKDDVLEGIKTIRRLTKENSSFLEKNPRFVREDGLIHTNFNQNLTGTGRLSSDKPNVQNQSAIPLSCFVTRY